MYDSPLGNSRFTKWRGIAGRSYVSTGLFRLVLGVEAVGQAIGVTGPRTDTDHAIVVGINHYPAYDPLEGPERDARDFVSWLVAPDGGGVPRENIALILSSDTDPPALSASDAQPTTEKIHHAIDAMLDSARGQYPIGRRLYLYLAGHGVTPQDGSMSDIRDAALLMANAALGRVHALPGRRYADIFARAALFEEVVLFMDCCREVIDKAPSYQPPYTPEDAPTPSRYCYAFATQWQRLAWEGPWGPDGVTRGLFSSVLLDGLRGNAAADQLTGLIDSRTLAAYVRQTLPLRDPLASAQQPEFLYTETPAITFGPSKVGRGLIQLVSQTTDLQGVQLYTGSFDKVEPDRHGPPLWEWRVNVGLYKLVVGSWSDLLDVNAAQPMVSRHV